MHDQKLTENYMRDEIRKASLEAGIDSDELRLVSHLKYRDILIRILDKRTTLGARGLESQWWWEHFKEPTEARQIVNNQVKFSVLFPPTEFVWFVAEDWYKKKKLGKYWLYEGTIGAIDKLYWEMFGFEFYIVHRKFEWLLCLNHDDILIASGEEAVERLRAVDTFSTDESR